MARINRRIAGIKVAIPTKEELECTQSGDAKHNMKMPDTATGTDINRSPDYVLKRM